MIVSSGSVKIFSRLFRKASYFGTIGAGIKSCCRTTRRSPDQIGIDGHAVIMRVELGDTPLINFFRMPFVLGEFIKRSPSKAQDRRHAQKRQLIEIALPQ